jgi:hypothetical protein
LLLDFLKLPVMKISKLSQMSFKIYSILLKVSRLIMKITIIGVMMAGIVTIIMVITTGMVEITMTGMTGIMAKITAGIMCVIMVAIKAIIIDMTATMTDMMV